MPYSQVAQVIINRQARYADAYNKRLKPVPTAEQIQVGDLVLRRRSEIVGRAESKLKAKWKGPYRVVRMESNGAVWLAEPNGQTLPRPRHPSSV